MTKSLPLLPDVGILALVDHAWNSTWQTPHHVLTRLAKFFYVVWSEPPHDWRDFVHCDIKKVRHPFVSGLPLLPAGFHVYTPEPWLPHLYRPSWLQKALFTQRLQQCISLLKQKGCQKIVLDLWRPRFETALENANFDLKLFHIDDEYSFATSPPTIDAREFRVLSRVDHVIIVSPGLLERKGQINCHTTYVPHGVDYERYAPPKPEPKDLAPIPRPRIGYAGILKKQLDWPLLEKLVIHHPEWSFVFVGPMNSGHRIEHFIQNMGYLKNVHFLGPKSISELACYPTNFDVCIMPYQVDGYTNNIFPLKLHEYLATGKPIVGSPIRTILDYSDVIIVAEGPDEWSNALSRALEPAANHPVAVIARQMIAHRHNWVRMISVLAQIICQRMGPTYLERLANLVDLE